MSWDSLGRDPPPPHRRVHAVVISEGVGQMLLSLMGSLNLSRASVSLVRKKTAKRAGHRKGGADAAEGEGSIERVERAFMVALAHEDVRQHARCQVRSGKTLYAHFMGEAHAPVRPSRRRERGDGATSPYALARSAGFASWSVAEQSGSGDTGDGHASGEEAGPDDAGALPSRAHRAPQAPRGASAVPRRTCSVPGWPLVAACAAAAIASNACTTEHEHTAGAY